MSCCEANHLSRDSIVQALNTGYHYTQPPRLRLDLAARYGTDAPVRLAKEIDLTSGVLGFFLDCRFLGYVGECPMGHQVDATNRNFAAIAVQLATPGVLKAFGWFEDVASAVPTTVGNLSVDSQQWHTVSLESLEKYLISRSGLDPDCQECIRAQFVTLRSLF